MINSILDTLPWWQLFAVGLCFVWSGFVRSGLGFGGAALSLPLLLMIESDPLIFLPAISFHLLFFSLLTVATRLQNIDWSFLVKILLAQSIPFTIGLIGLLNLPGSLLSITVYTVTLVYGFGYLLNRALTSKNRLVDVIFVALGGYAGGVSLIGAPLIAAVSNRYVKPAQLRDTLFAVWIVLVVFKIGTFVAADVNLQWRLTLLTFPLAAAGHYLGLRLHAHIVSGDSRRFERFIGMGLVAVSLLGLISLLFF